MNMFPHTVTVYNKMADEKTGISMYNITILRGVFLDISKGANVMKSGLVSADSATLYIPMSIKAINADTGEEQKFVGQKEYERLAQSDIHEYWTLRTGGISSTVDCFFVKGEVTDKSGFNDMKNRYDDVYDVSTVDTKDFGSKSMWHWEVGGS